MLPLLITDHWRLNLSHRMIHLTLLSDYYSVIEEKYCTLLSIIITIITSPVNERKPFSNVFFVMVQNILGWLFWIQEIMILVLSCCLYWFCLNFSSTMLSCCLWWHCLVFFSLTVQRESWCGNLPEQSFKSLSWIFIKKDKSWPMEWFDTATYPR